MMTDDISIRRTDISGYFRENISTIAMNDIPVREKPSHRQDLEKENSEYESRLGLLSGDSRYIDTVIREGSAGIRARDLYAILEQRELIGNKFAAVSSEYQQLKDQNRQIMRTLEAAALVNAPDPLPEHLVEVTFAAQYLLKEEDLTPDLISGVGLADDAILVKRVASRHGRALVRDSFSQ